MNTYILPLPRELQKTIWSFNDTSLVKEEYEQLSTRIYNMVFDGYHPELFMELTSLFERLCKIAPPRWFKTEKHRLEKCYLAISSYHTFDFEVSEEDLGEKWWDNYYYRFHRGYNSDEYDDDNTFQNYHFAHYDLYYISRAVFFWDGPTEDDWIKYV